MISVVEFPVTVTIEWPDDVILDEERVRDVAQCVVHSRCEIDIGPSGKIIWAKCFAETDENDVKFIEGEFA